MILQELGYLVEKVSFSPKRYVLRYGAALADDRCEMWEKRSMISCPHRPQQGRCNSHRSVSKYGIRVKKINTVPFYTVPVPLLNMYNKSKSSIAMIEIM
jgi:hypothetical protein